MPTKESLPDSWRCWVAENILLDVPAQQIEASAVSAGLKRSLVRGELLRARKSPYLRAGNRIMQRMNKLESMLRIRVEVARQNARKPSVPSFQHMAAAKFRKQFYARNKPVKLLEMLGDWPAAQRWTPSYFRERYGDQIVEVTAARNSDPNYEINLENHRRQICFSDFIDYVTTQDGNDSYLVANNCFFQHSVLSSMMDDIGPLPGYLTRKNRAPHTYMWFGPGGTVTPLHHDTMNILFCQIYGRKLITIIPPDETPWLYNEVAVYSDVQFENPDYDTHPLFQHVDPIEVVVNPGEILFIPVGWWHHVRSLDTSISVSFTNFAFPNEYAWRHPDLRSYS
jgi:hypothetical protein